MFFFFKIFYSNRNQRDLTIKRLHQKYSIDTPIIFWVICYLGIFSPDNFTTLCNHTKFANIDLNFKGEILYGIVFLIITYFENCSFGDDT
jgi:hypothetical protein